MQLICLSISHHNTPVELRENLSLSQELIEQSLANFPIRKGAFELIHEMVILSTCNRLELYALVSNDGESVKQTFQPLRAYLGTVLAVPLRLIDLYARTDSGIEAAEHLFQVAAGLDSIAIGETQILGQVARALDDALRQGCAGHVLSSLFRAAIHAGKRVRSETEIGRHPTSLSAIAIQLAETHLGALAGRKILVVGAGKMGSFALEALREHGATDIILANRTRQNADDLALASGSVVLPFERLAAGLAEADLVFTSTASPWPIISRAMAAAGMAQRPHRPLALIDLAVPRNIDPQVREIKGLTLFDMDDLQAYVASAGQNNLFEIAGAKKIVAEETAEYAKLLRVIPFIGELHKKIEQIRQREVERSLRQLRSPDPEVNQQIELLSRSLVRKILHEPTMHLRTETDQETLNDYVDALSRLFDLSENPSYSMLEETEKWA